MLSHVQEDFITICTLRFLILYDVLIVLRLVSVDYANSCLIWILKHLLLFQELFSQGARILLIRRINLESFLNFCQTLILTVKYLSQKVNRVRNIKHLLFDNFGKTMSTLRS